MSRQTVRPILPLAPGQYDPEFINQLSRELQNLIVEVRNPLSSAVQLPTEESLSVLGVGRLYQQDGVVKVVREEDK